MINFRNKGGFLKAIVERQYRAWKHEDIGYRAAFLGRMRNAINRYQQENNKYPNQEEYDKLQSKVYDEVNMLDTPEHWEINKANTLEQLFDNLNALHKKARNKDLVINKRYEELSKVTDIIDPDKFPIFSLIERYADEDLVSIWEYKPELLEEARKDIGFSLQVKQSKIEHHDAGDGVFLSCVEPGTKVCKGTLLGIVPGIIQSSYELPPQEDPRVEKSYLTCYDDTSIKFDAFLPYPLNFGYSLEEVYSNRESTEEHRKDKTGLTEVPGEFFNPYAVGHKINHPPPETPVNVILSDLIIPKAFFPDYLRQYLPYISLSSDKENKFVAEYYHNDCIHGIGILAAEDIVDGEELYCDYFEFQRYSMSFTPDWLIKPPPLSPYLTKFEYENNFSFLAKIIDAYIVSKQGNVYEEFLKKVKHDQDEHNLLKQTVIQDRINAAKNKVKKEQKA